MKKIVCMYVDVRVKGQKTLPSRFKGQGSEDRISQAMSIVHL